MTEKEIPMLDQQLAAQLKAYLERVTQPFELVASLDEGSVCQVIECEDKEATVFKEK